MSSSNITTAWRIGLWFPTSIYLLSVYFHGLQHDMHYCWFKGSFLPRSYFFTPYIPHPQFLNHYIQHPKIVSSPSGTAHRTGYFNRWYYNQRRHKILILLQKKCSTYSKSCLSSSMIHVINKKNKFTCIMRCNVKVMRNNSTKLVNCNLWPVPRYI